jgi:hypothetical protein
MGTFLRVPGRPQQGEPRAAWPPKGRGGKRSRMTVGRLSKTGLHTCLLAALVAIGCAFPSLVRGGDRIHAYRDATGRVIFENDPSSELPAPQTAPAAETSSQENVTSTPHGQPGQTAELERRPSVSPKPERAHAPLALAHAPAALVHAPAAKVGLASWEDAIQQAASRHQVDPDLVRAMVRVESNFNPKAVSPKGARGLMQLIPSTAQRFGVRNVFDANANLDGGVRYLKYLMDLFGGDVKLSLAAYNAGENAVGRHNGVPPYPETQDYLRKISELYPMARPLQAKGGSTGIEKFVDNNGTVHFSNTDLP